MAKIVKSIKCPDCGSGQWEQESNEQFRCSSCGNNFLVENDDVNIIHTYHSAEKKKKSLARRIIVGSLGVLLFVTFAIVMYYIGTNETYIYSENTKIEGWIISSELVNKENPTILTLVERERGVSEDRRGTYLIHFDVETQKTVKEEKIGDKMSMNNTTGKSKLFRLGDGDIYLAYGSQQLFKYNTNKRELEDVTHYVLNNTALEKGLGRIETPSPLRKDICATDAIEVSSTTGESYYYHPTTNKVYNESEYRKCQIAKNVSPSTLSDIPFYAILGSIGNRQGLVKINYNKHTDTPYSIRIASIDFYQFVKTKGKNKQVLQSLKNNSRVTNIEEVTPERDFFNAQVLYQDNLEIVLRSKNTIAKDEPYYLQSIKTNDPYQVNWTYLLGIGDRQTRVLSVFKANKGYIIKEEEKEFIYLDNDGILINKVNLKASK